MTSQQAAKLGNLEGKVLFSEIPLNPTELLYYVHALHVHGFYVLILGQGGKQSNWLLVFFYLVDGVKLERNCKNLWWLHAALNSVGKIFFYFFCAKIMKWFTCSINVIWHDSTVTQWLGTILVILNNCWCRMRMYRHSETYTGEYVWMH